MCSHSPAVKQAGRQKNLTREPVGAGAVAIAMSAVGILLFAQVGAAAMPTLSPPDVELSARVEAREITIEQDAPVRLKVHAEPGVTDLEVKRSQPAGARRYRNLTIDARLAAWLSPAADAGDTVTSKTTGEPE